MDRVVKAMVDGQEQDLHILEALRVRAQETYPEVVAEYVEAIEAGAVFPPIRAVLTYHGVTLVDGRHRIAAWEKLGLPIRATVGADGGHVLLVAIQANVRHGERRRFGDVRRCVELALEYWGHESNREIARMVKCSHTYVNAIREEVALAAGHVSTSESLEGSPLGSSNVPSAPAWQSPWAPDSFQLEEVMAVEPLDGRYAAGPEYIADEDGYPVFNIHNERPDLEVDPQRIKLAVGVDHGTAPDSQTVMLVGPDGRLVLPEAATEQPTVESVAKSYRGKDELERWYTDKELAAVCWRWLVRLGVLPGREVWTVLEPAVGDGAWVRGADLVRLGSAQMPKIAWDSCDLDGVAQRPWELRARGVVGDFLEVSWPDAFDLVITNPPNSLAFEFVKRAIELVVPGGVVAFLMPLSWYAAQGRRTWLEEHPPYRVGVCPWRPSFGGPAAELQGTGNGTPTQVYAMFVWMEGYQGETVLEIIPGGEVNSGEE